MEELELIENLPDSFYEVSSLQPYTSYTFTVMANTSESGGPGLSTSDPVSERTEEGGKFHATVHMIMLKESSDKLVVR